MPTAQDATRAMVTSEMPGFAIIAAWRGRI